MATQTNKKAAKKPEWKGYLRVNLTAEQDAHFDVWKVSQHVQLSDLDILLNNGFKFSLSWDVFHNGVSANLTANDVRLSWAGYVLTAWDTNVEDAILLLFYKHYIICEEDWEHFTDVVEKMGKKRG